MTRGYIFEKVWSEKPDNVLKKIKTIRNFVTPTLNFNASEYTHFIDWNSAKLSPPSLFRNITNDAIKYFIQSGEVPKRDVTTFPPHTQSVERCVKLVSEALLKFVGQNQGMVTLEQPYNPDQSYPTFTKTTF